MSIFIDKEMRALIPPLSEEELEQLEKNIVAEGIRDPLVTWPQPDGREMLIDGHNRFDISCRHNGIPFQVKQIDFPDKETAKVWVIKNQLGRRNIDSWKRFDLTKELEKLEKAKAKQRMSDGAKGVPMLAQAETGKTRDKMAKLVGVSHGTYDKMKAIDEKATDRTKKLVRAGELSINQAYNSVHPKRPNPIKEMVKDARKKHEEYLETKKEKTVDFQQAQADKENMEIIHTEMMQDILKALNAVDRVGLLYKSKELDGIGSLLDEKEKAIISDRCNKCRGILLMIQNAIINE